MSKLKISPGSHSATTSNGRQHTSQSVVNRWLGTLVSMTRSNAWPQNGHRIDSEASTRRIYPRAGKAQRFKRPPPFPVCDESSAPEKMQNNFARTFPA